MTFKVRVIMLQGLAYLFILNIIPMFIGILSVTEKVVLSREWHYKINVVANS